MNEERAWWFIVGMGMIVGFAAGLLAGKFSSCMSCFWCGIRAGYEQGQKDARENTDLQDSGQSH